MRSTSIRSIRTRCLTLAAALLTAGSDNLPAQTESRLSSPIERRYVPGEEYYYRLTSVERHNGGERTVMQGVSRHTIVEREGVPGEDVRWERLNVVSGREGLMLDSLARSITPYFISRARDGSVELPPLNISEMVGPITDLNTFFVSVHPSEGIAHLASVGDIHEDSSVVQGDFTDSVMVLLGNDCLNVSYELLRITGDTAVYRITYAPPRTSCLPMLRGDMSAAVVDSVPNNFQMIRDAGEGKVTLMWGVEEFIVTASVDRSNGMILRADMDNRLRLRLRINCSPDLNSWQWEMPFTIERDVTLELVAYSEW